jgi:hypothetical protein
MPGLPLKVSERNSFNPPIVELIVRWGFLFLLTNYKSNMRRILHSPTKAVHPYRFLKNPGRLSALIFFLFAFQSVHAQISLNFIVTEPLCFGIPGGSATVVATGGTQPYMYEWDTGATSATISGIPAGTYSVTVTDAMGSSEVGTVTVNQPPLLTVTLQAETCSAPFSITATGMGGVPPYEYIWSTGATGPTITGLSPGTYCVTVTDQNLCGAFNCITLDIEPLSVAVVANPVSCPNGDDGQVTATASGGTPPYSFLWSNGATTATQQNLAPGSYTVTVTDANNCMATAVGTVSSPPPISVNLNPTHPTCNGSTNGSVSVVASGGTPPYSYLWSTGATGTTISGLGEGDYSVTVTDANGCPAVGQVTLLSVSNLMVGALGTPETCPGFNDGFATASANFGVMPYTYAWSNGGSTQVLTNLAPGSYTVTVTDAVGCTGSATAVVNPATPFVLDVVATNVTTCGAVDGTVTANVVSGNPPYTYLWSTGATSSSISGLGGGTYSVTVTSAGGCMATGSATVSVPPDVSVQVMATPEVCPGESNGTAIAIPSGGTPPFNFLWSTGATSQSINSLPAGTYFVTVTDVNLCQAVGMVTINQPAEITVVLNAPVIDCAGASAGSIAATVSGGTSPYIYMWSTGATTPSISGLTAGTYGLTVTDANGCVYIDDAIIVSELPQLEIDFDISHIICVDDPIGAVTANVTGGTPPYSYQWSTGATGSSISGLPAGMYSLTVTDANGCEATGVALVEQIPGLVVDIETTDVSCPGDMDGTASAVITGGTGPFTYVWNTGATGQTITGLAPGVYSVTATDASGCSGEASATVGEPDAIDLSVSGVDATCEGASDGQATVTAAGGTPPYSYAWSNGATGATATGLAAGTYTATVTDDNGCEAEASVDIGEPDAIQVFVDELSGTCAGSSQGSASADAVGGTPPYSFVWSNGETGSNSGNLAAGTYSVTVTDANGCIGVGSVDIMEYPNPSCLIVVISEVSGINTNDGELQVIPTGGTGPYSYLWSNGQTGTNATNLAPGTYSVTVTDANGCTTVCEEELIGPALIGDYVWLDIDRDGIQDPNEPGIPNVKVIVNGVGDNSNYVDTTYTNANGIYHFEVPPGSYKVTFCSPGSLFTPTMADQGSDDALDSDADEVMLMSHIVTVEAGDIDLTIDAGFYHICENITDPGVIGYDQYLCGPGVDADPIISVEDASGGSGDLIYLWMKSTLPGPFNDQTWMVIPNSNSPSYDPGPIYQTTYFARCARRDDCITFLETQIITITVGDEAVADIEGPQLICEDQPATYYAAGVGPGAIVEWNFGIGASPATATGTPATVTYSSFGTFHIMLSVTENGCTSTDIFTITSSNSPTLCGSGLAIDLSLVDEEHVMVQWQLGIFAGDYMFEVEHSADGETFDPIGVVSDPANTVAGMRRYELLHTSPKKGRNFYRVKVIDHQGQSSYSEVEEIIIFGDSKLTMIYPNPVTDDLVLEIFESFNEDITLEIFAANGALMSRVQLPSDTTRQVVPFGDFPAGAYFLRIRFGKTDVKTLKVIKE